MVLLTTESGNPTLKDMIIDACGNYFEPLKKYGLPVAIGALSLPALGWFLGRKNNKKAAYTTLGVLATALLGVSTLKIKEAPDKMVNSQNVTIMYAKEFSEPDKKIEVTPASIAVGVPMVFLSNLAFYDILTSKPEHLVTYISINGPDGNNSFSCRYKLSGHVKPEDLKEDMLQIPTIEAGIIMVEGMTKRDKVRGKEKKQLYKSIADNILDQEKETLIKEYFRVEE